MSAPVPPHSLERERALLGSVLLDGNVWGIVESVLTREDFHSPAHAAVWDAFGNLSAREQPIDHVTVREALTRAGKHGAVGGDEFLFSLTETLPTTGHAEAHARAILALANRRRVIAACLAAANRGYDLEVETGAYLSETETAVLAAIRSTTGNAGLVHVSEPLRQVFELMQATARAGGSGVTGLSTGLADLDRFITGLHPGELTIVAGRPGMGKSAFMSGLMLAAADHAREQDGSVACFSLEMQAVMAAMRLVVAHSGVDLKGMRAARLGADEIRELARSAEWLHQKPIYVDETPGVTLAAIRSQCRRLRARGRIALVVVDYLQLMRGAKGLEREQVISESSRGLKELSKELECPVVALSQLNRDVEKRPDKRPQLSDLRESGAIEQDADNVLMLYRRGYYAAQAAANKPDPRAPRSDIEPGDDDGVTEIIVAKQRNGGVGVVKCLFRETSAHFVALEQAYGDDEYPSHWQDRDG